jgi:hypothetical protein
MALGFDSERLGRRPEQMCSAKTPAAHGVKKAWSCGRLRREQALRQAVFFMTSASGNIVQADAPATSVITSLPDVSELPGLSLEAWRSWFIAAAEAVIAWIPADGVAIFYQTDIRKRGVWVDKGYLVQRAAEAQGAQLVWHKIVCRQAPGSVSLGRPSYAHLMCVAKRELPEIPAARAGADVLPELGTQSWSRAMGSEACRVACAFLRAATPTRLVVDPFCGRGSALAHALTTGFDVLGIDLSAKRCRAARAALRAIQRQIAPTA